MKKNILIPGEILHIELGQVAELIASALSEDSDDIAEWIRYQVALREWSMLVKDSILSGHLIPLNPLTLIRQDGVLGDALDRSVITQESFIAFLKRSGFEDQTIKAISKNLVHIDVPKPEPRLRYQGKAILAALKKLSYDAENLPLYKNGRPGVKSEIKNFLLKGDGFTDVSFDKAWRRLKKDGSIAYADKPPQCF